MCDVVLRLGACGPRGWDRGVDLFIVTQLVFVAKTNITEIAMHAFSPAKVARRVQVDEHVPEALWLRRYTWQSQI